MYNQGIQNYSSDSIIPDEIDSIDDFIEQENNNII